MRLRLLSRSPLAYWAAVAALALVTTLAVSQLMGRARTEAARYGSPRPVVIATHDIGIGSALAGGDVIVRSLPSALVPPDAVGDPAQVRGRVVVVPVFEGQPVVRRQLAPWGRTGAAALLPPGKRGISVAAGPAATKLTKGDTVDVLATFDPATPVSDQSNLYATLTELNHFTDEGVAFNAQYGTDGPQMTDPRPPFGKLVAPVDQPPVVGADAGEAVLVLLGLGRAGEQHPLTAARA